MDQLRLANSREQIDVPLGAARARVTRRPEKMQWVSMRAILIQWWLGR